MTKKLFLALLFSGLSLSGFAQFYPTQYRPAGLDWQQLKTPHFNIVFPAGEDSAAWRSARILEAQYGSTRDLTGGGVSNFPVILTNYNDRSNGFVSTNHFRSEIDLHPIRGKSLSPKSGNWLETVVPHELVHAQQFSNPGRLGVGSIVTVFSPDLARSLYGAIPSGVAEGLATYHESSGVFPGGGRGNLPFFTNQFDAIFNSYDRWSMGQMVHFPARTRPFNRHYIGGYEFTSWLQQTYGDNTAKDALDFYIRMPFLGYGVALLHATGKWPAELYSEFETDTRIRLASEKEHDQKLAVLPIGYEGASVRRPLWIDGETLIFYGSFYNARSGFYRYDLETQEASLIKETSSVQDYIYDLSAGKSKLLFSYYKASPIYETIFQSALATLNLKDGRMTDVKDSKGLYAPVNMGNEVWALEHQHDANRLIAVFGSSRLELSDLSPHRIIHFEPNPKNIEKLAVVINKRGTQALWLARTESLEEDLKGEPTIVFSDGSVYDPVWHPSGDKILFTADINGSMNIYEYDIEEDQIIQQTNNRYNSLEAAYNEDGSAIAFVRQKKNEMLPAVLQRADFYGQPISASLWKPASEKSAFMERPEMGREEDLGTDSWSTGSYTSGFSWLKPRTLLPLFEEVSNRDVYELGLSLHSNNLLQSQSYSLDLSYVQDRFWYDLTYRNKQFFPGFKARVFSRPSFTTIQASGSGTATNISFLTQRRGASLSLPARFVIENNVRFSSFFIEPELRYSQLRFFELNHNGKAASNFADIAIANVFSSFSYKLQQNIRDVQPNSGITIFSELEYYLSAENLNIQTPQVGGQLSFSEPYALRGGLFTYLSPLRRWNQSLRLGLQATTQSNPVFDNQSLVSNGFSEDVFPFAKDVVGLSTRYTIPLVYPDDGGLLLPLYLSNIYLVAFSNTVSQYNEPNFLDGSRTVIGGGIRFQFRISNLALDIGVGYGYEISRNNHTFFIGDF